MPVNLIKSSCAKPYWIIWSNIFLPTDCNGQMIINRMLLTLFFVQILHIGVLQLIDRVILFRLYLKLKYSRVDIKWKQCVNGYNILGKPTKKVFADILHFWSREYVVILPHFQNLSQEPGSSVPHVFRTLVGTRRPEKNTPLWNLHFMGLNNNKS